MKYNKTYLARRLALSLIIGGMFVSSAYALPQGGAVVGGSSSGTIGGSGNIMNITGTGSNNVAIRWEQFNIANGETANFTKMASVLNYVTGNTKSEIYGALNGQGVNVFLFNPNGILFGKGAAVNVGSLHASTGKMTDENINGFNGTPMVDLSNVTADVLNLGVIRADKVTIEGANISLGNAADIKKQNGDAITAADKANYVLKADGVVNVGYETTGTKTFSVIENGKSQDHTIRDYGTGAAATGSTLFTGSKLNGSDANSINDCMLISDIYELQNIQDDRTGRYMLTNNIAGAVTKTWNNGTGFKPLHADSGWEFRGIFDGAGYKINDLYINDTSGDYTGLFGRLGQNGRLSNVGLENSDITGGNIVGGIAGVNAGSTISNVYNKGSVTLNFTGSGYGEVGGIVGENGTTPSIDGDKYNATAVLENAVNYAQVTAEAADNNKILHAGGIAGYNYATVKNVVNEITSAVNNKATESSASTGGVIGGNRSGQYTVTQLVNKGVVTGLTRVGGVIGTMNYTVDVTDRPDSTVSNALNTGTVTNQGIPTIDFLRHTGGIIGYQGEKQTLQDSHNEGTVTGKGYVGGIAGYNEGIITSVSNSGEIKEIAGSSQAHVGGIAGYTYMTSQIENVYNKGAVTGQCRVAGIVARDTGSIKSAYNSGVVTANVISTGAVLAGGIVAEQDRSSQIENAYNTAAVTVSVNGGSGVSFVGGIVGGNAGSIKNIYNTGAITNKDKITYGVIGTTSGSSHTLTNAYYFDPATQLYYDDSGNTYATTEAFNTAFMTGAAASGEQDAWLVYSAGQGTPLLQGLLSPLDIRIGDIEVEIEEGGSYTELVQTIASKLKALGVDIDPSKIKALEVKETGTYDLSSLLYSTQDGYKITIGDGGKLKVKLKTDPPVNPPTDLPAINSTAYQAALINVQHTDDELKAVQQKLEAEKRAEDEKSRVKIQGTGIRM